DQGDISALITADDLGIVSLAFVGRDRHLVGAVDDVVVGHGKAIGRDEEAGALAGHLTRPAAEPGNAFLATEAPEETFHWRARRERRVVGAVATRVRLLLADVDAHRDYRRFDSLHDVGEADRTLHL